MIFTPAKIEGAYLVDVEPIVDERGFFARSWCQEEFRSLGLATEITQTNIASTHVKGTIRGLHYQAAPFEEAKLVRCVRGAAFVVALDLRVDSSSYGRWIGVELTADNHRALFVPKGCAQGYQTLVDNTELFYQMSRSYAPEAARGVRYNDPAFAIRWPMKASVLSERDRSWPDYQLVN